jgi:hypothetical protein
MKKNLSFTLPLGGYAYFDDFVKPLTKLSLQSMFSFKILKSLPLSLRATTYPMKSGFEADTNGNFSFLGTPILNFTLYLISYTTSLQAVNPCQFVPLIPITFRYNVIKN